jgi:ribosomal protein S8
MSRPGCRVYVRRSEIPGARRDGNQHLTTPRGVMTGRQARKKAWAASCCADLLKEQ